MSEFRDRIKQFVGKKVTFNFGIDFSGSGTLAHVHGDCVEIHHAKRNHPQDRLPSGIRKQFVPLAHLHSIAEAE